MKGSADSPRNLVAVGAIATASIVGFVSIVSAPLNASLTRTRATLDALTSGQRNSPQLHHAEALTQRARALDAWVGEQSGADQSTQYQRLLMLAERLDVRVERIDPVPPRRGSDADVMTYGFTLDAMGSYEHVARLIEGVESELGAATVARFSLTPAGRTNRGDSVRVTLETSHVQLKPTETVARAGGTQ